MAAISQLAISPAAAAENKARPSCTPVEVVRPTLGPAAQARLKSLMRQMIEKRIAPGAVLVIEQRGRVVTSIVDGHADAERQEPMAADSLFRIYSMTKPLTAVAALQLVDQGRLRLDDPVGRFIPEMNSLRAWVGSGEVTATEPLKRPLTVRDLLTHSAGFGYQGDQAHPVLRLYGTKGIGAGPGVGGTPTDGSAPATGLAEFTRKLATLPLLHQPGVQFTYGNASDVLGRVVEVAAGQPLAALMNAAIFRPLGMTSTSFGIPAGQEGKLTSAYLAKSHAAPAAGVFDVPDIEDLPTGALSRIDDGRASIFAQKDRIDYGGAGLISTADDYLRFTRMLRERGGADGKRLISEQLAEAMMSNQLEPQARLGAKMLDQASFGFGIGVRTAPTRASPAFPQCSAFWGGAGSTFFWVDRAGETSGVLMTQVFGGDVKSYWLAMMKELYGPSN
jgi:CubicO group peptidase (beta-lactamase class C family)